MVLLVVRDDNKYIGPILKGLSIDIPQGKTVAFVGSSGSGKSSKALSLFPFLTFSLGPVWQTKRIPSVSTQTYFSSLVIVE
jgi:ABC-type multidrug transport system fused ATPase/permease subunit